MKILLSKDVERSIEAAVHGGYFTSVDDAMDKAARLLLKNLEQLQPAAESGRPAAKTKKKQKETTVAKQPMTEDEFLKHLLNTGLMSQLPNREADFDDPDDEPIKIKGEPLSETIIRERR